MSFLASKKASPQSATIWPTYTGLRLQTSANSMPIPLMWGMTKLAVNIFFYANFQAHPVFTPQQQTGKGGGKGAGGVTMQLSGWTYSADLAMALCEGPISGIGQVWQGQSVYGSASSSSGVWYGGGASGSGFSSASGTSGLSALGLTLFNGTSPQATWGYLAANYSSQALAYPGTAYVCAANFGLGSSASIGTLNFEVQGPLFGTGANGLDADPAQVIADFLINPQYGVGFPGASIDAASLLGSGGDASVQSYCRAMGLCFSPQLNQIEVASSVLTRWLQLLSVAAVWSGDRLRFIPYCDEPVAGNGVEYVPKLTPAYALGDDDLVYSPGEDPIKASRIDPFTLSNFQWLEALNRTGLPPSTTGILEAQGEPEYQATPVGARDQAMIEQYGLRVGSTVTAHEFCDLNAAAVAAQTILQRGLYVRATYKFALSWEFCLLDPMDIVTLTDANLGLSGELVRIVDIEEDDSGMLSVTAEELTIGVSMPAINPIGYSGGSSINKGVAAAPVNPPLIYEPPPALSNNAAVIWFGASGSGADPNWGGCTVWASLDNVSYQKITTISNPMRQGVLTGPLPIASGYDVSNALAVDLSESGGTLATSTQAAAEAGRTLCLVENELIGFSAATPTAANRYNLTGLPRGIYGSSPASHAAGAFFARLDGAVAQYTLPTDFIGRTVYLKFQSFNVFGAGLQDISTCAVYSYVPNGDSQISQIVLNMEQGLAQDWGLASAAATQGDDWGTSGNPYYVAVDLGGLSA
jgi:hypothetical protein